MTAPTHCRLPEPTRPALLMQHAGVTFATTSYRNWQPWMGLPIRTSVGHPRFIKYQLAGAALELAPERSWLNLERAMYEQLYRDRLDHLDAAGYPMFALYELARGLRLAAKKRRGARLVFLCYEDLAKPGAWCHRRILADWLEQYGIACPELTPKGDHR